MLERDILQQILLEFAGDQRLRIWRNAVGAGRVAGGQFARFGLPGSADLSGIIRGTGQRIELEVKAEKGRQSTEQIAFGEMINKFGGLYFIVRSASEARQVVEPYLPKA